MKQLFEIEYIKKDKKDKNKCKHCKFIFRWRDHLSIFYCTKNKSNKTANGLLKVKANQEACFSFKRIEK